VFGGGGFDQLVAHGLVWRWKDDALVWSGPNKPFAGSG
jgi:hypothetical protein